MDQDINPIPPWIVDGAGVIFATAFGVVIKAYFALRAEGVKTAETRAEAEQKMRDRIGQLESQLSLINATVVPIATAMQTILISRLTHFHTPVMDALLVKVGPPNTLTPEEDKDLAAMLVERSKDMRSEIPQDEREAAEILPVIMKWARIEQQVIANAEDLKLKIISVGHVIAVQDLHTEPQ